MKDHHTWRASWLAPRSDYTFTEEYYSREERRHAIAALLGALTAIICAAALVAIVTN